VIPAALAAAGVYFVLNTGLLALALALGVGAELVDALARPLLLDDRSLPRLRRGCGGDGDRYGSMHAYALLVFALPLVLIRRTQEAYLNHTQGSQRRLRTAAELIKKQNVSLAEANQLLRERSTAAMESLSATVDARDSYTAGHSRSRTEAGAGHRPRARALGAGAGPARSCGSLP